MKQHFDFGGELLLGHLRYGTSGGYNLSACHPFFRRSPWPTRNLALCGNFNLTNTRELNDSLIAMGQHPIFATDTQAVLEKIGFFLDEEHEDIYRFLRKRDLSGEEMSQRISEDLDLTRVLTRASQKWDGGYVLCGLIGNGDAFVARDPSGHPPVLFFQNDEVVAFASERAPLMTVFDLAVEDVREVAPGHVVVIKRRGTISENAFTAPLPRAACSFERIYFSRGNDVDIYRERKALGGCLCRPGASGDRRRLGQHRLQLHPQHRRGGLLRAHVRPAGAPARRGQGGDPAGEPAGHASTRPCSTS